MKPSLSESADTFPASRPFAKERPDYGVDLVLVTDKGKTKIPLSGGLYRVP